MIQNLFAVLDSASELYGRIFQAPTRAAAVRAFSDEVNRSGSEFNNHPDDFVLWQVGVFDDTQGTLDMVREVVCRAKDLVKE